MFKSARWLLLLAALPATAQDLEDDTCCTRRSMAPAGLLYERLQDPGRFTIAYRLEISQFSGALKGSTPAGSGALAEAGFRDIQGLNSGQHMVQARVGLLPNLTLIGLLPYHQNTLSFKRGTSAADTIDQRTRSSGLGDPRILALIGLLKRPNEQFLLQIGAGLPVGSITKSSSLGRVGYAMQPGSGSFSVEPGLIWSSYRGADAWGAQSRASFFLNDNSQNYRPGHVVNTTAWYARQLATGFSLSGRAAHAYQTKVLGRDTRLEAQDAGDPTARAANTGGQAVQLLAGLGITNSPQASTFQRFLVEFGLPVYQNLNGFQPRQRWQLQVSWQITL